MTTEKSAADSSQSSEQNTTDNKVLQKARNKNRGKGKFELGTLGLVAGSFDFLGLEGLINENVGKKGSHVRANTGVEVKALIVNDKNYFLCSVRQTDCFDQTFMRLCPQKHSHYAAFCDS